MYFLTLKKMFLMKTSIIDVLDGTKKSIYSTIGQNFTIGKQWGSE